MEFGFGSNRYDYFGPPVVVELRQHRHPAGEPFTWPRGENLIGRWMLGDDRQMNVELGWLDGLFQWWQVDPKGDNRLDRPLGAVRDYRQTRVSVSMMNSYGRALLSEIVSRGFGLRGQQIIESSLDGQVWSVMWQEW